MQDPKLEIIGEGRPSEEVAMVTLPTIMVGWNADVQVAELKFNPSDFKQWSFVEAVLLLAAKKAAHFQRLADAKAMQQAHVEAMQAEAIKRSLNGRH